MVLNEKVHVLAFINYWIKNARWNIEKKITKGMFTYLPHQHRPDALVSFITIH